MSFLRLVWAVYSITIELTRTNPLNPDVPHVTSAVAHGIQINNLSGGCVFGMIKQLKPNAAGVTAEQSKVNSSSTFMGSQWQRIAHLNFSAFADLRHVIMQQS